MKTSRTQNIVRGALHRRGLTVKEGCRLACIAVSTYCDHARNDSLTQDELKRLDRVVRFYDGEILELIRGGRQHEAYKNIR